VPAKPKDPEEYSPDMTPERRKFLKGMAASQKKAEARSEKISRKDKEQLYEVAPAPPTTRSYKSGGYVSKADGCVQSGRTKGKFV